MPFPAFSALPGLAQIFAAGIVWSIITAIPRVLAALGVSVVVFVGSEILLDQIQAHINTTLGGLSADALQMFRYAGGDTALQIWFSMFSAVATVKAGRAMFDWKSRRLAA